MDTLQRELGHRCYGCIHDADQYVAGCSGCRRRANINYDTPEEEVKYLDLKDKYEPVVLFGTSRVLVKK